MDRKAKTAYVKGWNHRWRGRALMFFGGQCAHCGFNDLRALQLDHINGDGAREKTSNRGGTYYRRAVEAGHSKFQVLCANCNWIKRADNGEVGGK